MPNILLFADDAARIAMRSYRNGSEIDPEDDLSSYGPGKSLVISQRQMRRQGPANNWSALRSQNYAFLGGVPQIAFSSFHTQRGEVLSTLADNSVGIASYPALSAVMNPALRFILPSALGAAGTASITAMLAILPAYGLGKAVKSGVRYFNSFGYRLRHIEQGGDYQDTETALNLRMRSISDMSSAMSYSRRWLGNEALFMR
jgi:hypothetical protein